MMSVWYNWLVFIWGLGDGGIFSRYLEIKRYISNEYWVCRFYIFCGICCRLFFNFY